MIKFLWCQLSHFGDNNNCDHITFFRIVFCKISIERNKIKQKKYAKKLHVLFTEVLSILIPVVWSECQKGLGLNLYIEIKKEKNFLNVPVAVLTNVFYQRFHAVLYSIISNQKCIFFSKLKKSNQTLHVVFQTHPVIWSHCSSSHKHCNWHSSP